MKTAKTVILALVPKLSSLLQYSSLSDVVPRNHDSKYRLPYGQILLSTLISTRATIEMHILGLSWIGMVGYRSSLPCSWA